MNTPGYLCVTIVSQKALVASVLPDMIQAVGYYLYSHTSQRAQLR